MRVEPQVLVWGHFLCYHRILYPALTLPCCDAELSATTQVTLSDVPRAKASSMSNRALEIAPNELRKEYQKHGNCVSKSHSNFCDVGLNIGYSKIRWRIIVFSQPNFPREGRSHFGHSHVKHRSDKMLATTCPSIGWPAPWESCHHCMFVQRWGI